MRRTATKLGEWPKGGESLKCVMVFFSLGGLVCDNHTQNPRWTEPTQFSLTYRRYTMEVEVC